MKLFTQLKKINQQANSSLTSPQAVLFFIFTLLISQTNVMAQCSTCTGGTSNFSWYNGTSGAQWSINAPATNGTTTNVYTFNGPSGPATVSVKIADLPTPNGSMVVNSGECAALASGGGIFNQFFTGTTGQTAPGACTPNTNTGPGYLQLARSTAINSNVPANSVFRITFKFSTPAYVSNFRIVDIDFFGTGTPAATSTSNYQDRVRVRGHRAATAVNLFATNSNVGGASIVTVAGNNSTQVTGTSAYAAADGNETNPGDPTDQRTWMIINSGCNLVDSITVDYDNNRTNNNLLQMIALGGFDFCYKTVSVSGNIFNDKDGISNGFTGATKIASLSGVPLYAYLVGPTGNVVSTPIPVASDGSFLFPNVTSANYTVAISTTNTGAAGIGAPAPATNFPSGWVSTGEINGTGTTGDGTANGRSATLAVDATGSDILNVNFGIQKIPEAPNQSYAVSQPLPNSSRTLNGSGASNSPGALRGTDLEDGTLGSGNAFRITSITGLNGNRLLYNGVLITGPLTISNYNPSLLTLQYAGLGSTNASFNYASVDAAGFQSNAATYSVAWLTALPVHRFEASAVINNSVIQVKWLTQDEENTRRFLVERSVNAIDFETIGTVAAATNFNGVKNYSYLNNINNTSASILYYRIKLEDQDGKITYSNTVTLRLNSMDKVQVYPNPIVNQFTISYTSQFVSPVTISLYDKEGRLLLQKNQTVAAGVNQIPVTGLGHLAKGAYVVKLANASGTINFVTGIIK